MNTATIWLTGLPASGKTTMALALCKALREKGQQAVVLDGDALRQGLSTDLGFSEAHRNEHTRRVGALACLLGQQGVYAVVSLISPYAASRNAVRAAHQQRNLKFLEIYINTPLEICIQRDPKGLYAKAKVGEIKGLTGIDAPYEPPTQSDMVIHTPTQPLEQAVKRLLELLKI